MIILFGSYAHDEWVEDIYTEGHITYEYISDFDVLVLTRLKKTTANHSKQNSVDDLILQHKAIKTPVTHGSKTEADQSEISFIFLISFFLKYYFIIF
jgi:predicted nucleotidyltransferase